MPYSNCSNFSRIVDNYLVSLPKLYPGPVSKQPQAQCNRSAFQAVAGQKAFGKKSALAPLPFDSASSNFFCSLVHILATIGANLAEIERATAPQTAPTPPPLKARYLRFEAELIHPLRRDYVYRPYLQVHRVSLRSVGNSLVGTRKTSLFTNLQ